MSNMSDLSLCQYYLVSDGTVGGDVGAVERESGRYYLVSDGTVGGDVGAVER